MIALLFTQRTYYALRNAKKSYFPFAFHSFFRKFAIEDGLVFRFAQGNFSVSAKKKPVSLFCARLFVTLWQNK